jgi:hypothetical protein
MLCMSGAASAAAGTAPTARKSATARTQAAETEAVLDDLDVLNMSIPLDLFVKA